MAAAALFNQYEQAFESWLIDNRLRYTAVDQQKRRIFAQSRIKSFDFLLYPVDSPPLIVEVKGRTFKGKSLCDMHGLDCWVTMEDVSGLIRWERIWGCGIKALFIFAYRFEKIDVETDGIQVYDFMGDRYVFYVVRLDDYRTFMTVRSPKWRTITLPAAKFREFAVPANQLLL